MFLTERIASLIAPAACLHCHAEGAMLCHNCLVSALPALPGRCYVCLTKINAGSVCNACLPATLLAFIAAAGAYDGLAKQLVHEFKFTHRRAAAEAMAAAILPALPRLPKETIVTHVPTAARRKRERGYDQAALLARALAARLKLPYAALLERTGSARQVGSGRATRRTQLHGAFRPLRTYITAGAPVLLIDDILTTGGTLEAAAVVLRQAGATQVGAAVFAQAL